MLVQHRSCGCIEITSHFSKVLLLFNFKCSSIFAVFFRVRLCSSILKQRTESGHNCRLKIQNQKYDYLYAESAGKTSLAMKITITQEQFSRFGAVRGNLDNTQILSVIKHASTEDNKTYSKETTLLLSVATE